MDTPHSQAALTDKQLYNTIVGHRKLFYALSGVNYQTNDPATIDFVPKGEALERFEKDYELMRNQMIYSPKPLTFEGLMERMIQLQLRFRANSRNPV